MFFYSKDFRTLFAFENLLKVYNFKSFKKNLRFKKIGRGVTKFIKNRKKYFIRKRRTSNAFDYTYLYIWSKIYILHKQLIRYTQLLYSGSISFSSTNLFCIYRLNKMAPGKLGFNSLKSLSFSTTSKNVFFNNTYFLKKNYVFLNKLYLNSFLLNFNTIENIKATQALIEKDFTDFIFSDNKIFKSQSKRISVNPTSSVVFSSFIYSITYNLVLTLVQIRKLFVLFILWKI